MSPTDPQRASRGPAAELRDAWETRARSPYRGFYVASHRGWDDEERVQQQARFDAEVVLHDLDPAWLGRADVLEIGCGSGRLAQHIAPRVHSYTGIDIAPTMVALASERLRRLPNARIQLGSGEGIPAQAADRTYALVFSHAVLIHCPREIIAAYVGAAWELLAPGGELRLQLLAESGDPTGIEPLSSVPALPQAPPADEQRDLRPEEQRALAAIERELRGSYYMGSRFRFAEVGPFLADLAPGAALRLMRCDPEHIYVDLRRDEET